jgi:hypothetical protein
VCWSSELSQELQSEALTLRRCIRIIAACRERLGRFVASVACVVRSQTQTGPESVKFCGVIGEIICPLLGSGGEDAKVGIGIEPNVSSSAMAANLSRFRAMERMMKLQDVLLKAMAKKITCWEAAEII